MRFRSKSPDKVLAELDVLAARHHTLEFVTVDNILDMRYFDDLLPRLAERGHDHSFFYETKANLSVERVIALRDAGVRAIQPGIESLSTPILRQMKKGVTALQNIRLLKWCSRYGIRVVWNLLYGFPREDPLEYARMAELAPSLAHFTPPDLVRMMVYRFSPYHQDPERHGLRLNGPLPYYGLLHDADAATREALAQAFEYEHADGRDPESYVGALRESVERWRRDAERNRDALTYRRGPGFLVITDTRTTTTSAPLKYTLAEHEARIYLACESGAARSALAEIAVESSAQDLDALLRNLLEARLLIECDGKFLSLAQPRFVETGDPWISKRAQARAAASFSTASA
jgi:ribosomal peptide maturation radical SAM protein 1